MRQAVPDEVVEALRSARSVVAVTGAGVSAESGIRTFRDGNAGLWTRYDPAELATPEAFERDPTLVTEWYDWRRGCAAGCEPNAGHLALVRLGRELAGRGGSLTLVTQNVDGLHQRAGSEGVVELHWSLWWWRCAGCGEEREERTVPFADHPPRCVCGGVRRPGVVWFGEPLPEAALRRAIEAAGGCELFLSIGTSGVVYPAAGLVDVARGGGAKTVEVNAERTPLSGEVDHALTGPSGQLLPRLVERAFGGEGLNV